MHRALAPRARPPCPCAETRPPAKRARAAPLRRRASSPRARPRAGAARLHRGGEAHSCRAEILDGNRLDGVGHLEAENACVEVELGVERALDVLRAPKAVPFARERDVRHRQTLLTQ